MGKRYPLIQGFVGFLYSSRSSSCPWRAQDGHLFPLQSKVEPMEEFRADITYYQGGLLQGCGGADQQGHCIGESLALTLCVIAVPLVQGAGLTLGQCPSEQHMDTARTPVEKGAGYMGGKWLKAHSAPGREKIWL